MSAGFNFTNITLESSADITDVMDNFNKIEELGITKEEATAVVTTESAGLMSAADKTKLDGIAAGAQVNNITTVTLNGVSQTISSGTLAMTETDPTVPSWAKAESKPSYVWSEIGSKPTFVTQQVVGNFWIGSQADYDLIETKNATTMYMIYEEAD